MLHVDANKKENLEFTCEVVRPGLVEHLHLKLLGAHLYTINETRNLR